jgi:hypothetical protein
MPDAVGARAPESEDEEDDEGDMDTVSKAFENIVRNAHDAEAVG